MRTPTAPAQIPLRNGQSHTQTCPPDPPNRTHISPSTIGRLLLLPCQRLVRRLYGVSHGGQVGLGLGELVHSLKALLFPAPPHLSDVLGLRLEGL